MLRLTGAFVAAASGYALYACLYASVVMLMRAEALVMAGLLVASMLVMATGVCAVVVWVGKSEVASE